MRFEFEGIPSGDWECFCWAVDRETFVRLEGHEPDKYDCDRFNEGLYKVYPDCFVQKDPYAESQIKVKVTITVEETE